MKKTFITIIAVLMTLSLSAQGRSILLEENFNSVMFPTGWQKMGDGTSNWHISQSNLAGGDFNELKLDWTPIFNGVARVVTPPLDLTGMQSVGMSFVHFFNNFDGEHTLSIETSSDGGNTWHEAWSQHHVQTEITNQYSESIQISTSDIGHSSVLFSITYNGNTDKLTAWYFDDITIFEMSSLNLSLNSIDIDDILTAGKNEVFFTIENKGSQPISNFTVSLSVDGEEIAEETFNDGMEPLEIRQYSFISKAFLMPENKNICVTIKSINGGNDEDPNDNTITKEINVSKGKTQTIAMIEHFSSSTCVPCVNVNVKMTEICNNNPGKYTYTKYQMNYPGLGDPYYVADCGVRQAYYGYSGVPIVVLTGRHLMFQAFTQELFDQEYERPAFCEVRGTFSVEGSVINVKADFMSLCDNSEAKAFIAVNEKETTGNVGTNGEVSFHHIFMKFITNNNGDELNINAGDYQHLEYSIDLSSTNVEEYNDLEVSAWIQNYDSQEVLNSHFLYENASIFPYPVTNLTLDYDGTETLTATWVKPEQSDPVSYKVYVDNELVADNVTETSFSIPVSRNELHSISVRANYEDMESVLVTELIEIVYDDIQETEEAKVSVFPNPTSGRVVISGDNIEQIEVINILGQKIMSVDVNSQHTTISMNDYPNGAYILLIKDKYGNTSKSILVKQ